MLENKQKFGRKNVGNMDKTAKTTFAPVYPAIADSIIERFNITKGICIDLGSGPAPLAIALAKKTGLSIISFDISKDMQDKAEKNIEEAGLSNQISLLNGDVHNILLENDYADLIISRGSIFFWKDLHTAFSEIYRILKPGGKTFIGGGFGNKEIFEKIRSEKLKKDPESNFPKEKISIKNRDKYRQTLLDIGVSDFEIIFGDDELWVIISKSKPGALQ